MLQNSNRNLFGRVSNKVTWSTIIAFLVISLTTLIYIPGIYNVLGAHQVLAIYDSIVISVACCGAVLAARLWHKYEHGEVLSFISGNIAIGLTLWAVGEIIWSSDQLWGGKSLPYPSTADIVWVIGYVPVALAFIVRLYTLRIIANKPWQFLAIIIYTTLSILAIFFILIPILGDSSSPPGFEKVVNLLYPIGDLIIGLLALYLVLVLMGGTLFRSWGLIAIGFFCCATSDLLYALTVWQGTFRANASTGIGLNSFIIDWLYVVFYSLVALGLSRQATSP